MTARTNGSTVAPRPSGREDVGRTGLSRRWVITTTVAECVGFAIPAVTAAVAYSAGLSEPGLYGMLVAAGAAEGAILGAGQASVLAHELQGFDRRTWIGATAAAAAFAWSLGLIPAAVAEDIDTYPIVAVVAGGITLGMALLASLGVAQWLVLRRYVDGAAAWIPANGAAWLVGLGACIASMSVLIDEATSLVSTIAIALGSGLVMATLVAVVTGWMLVRLVDPRRRS